VADQDSQQGKVHLLARMMDLDNDERRLWSEEELAAIFEHQLSAPVEFDFNYPRGLSVQRVETLCSAATPRIMSFRDLLFHPSPPLEVLKTTKEFARACRLLPDGPVPDEIATMLYVLSIVAAATKCGQWITKMESGGVEHALDWSLEQSWIDEPTRDLLRQGRETFARQELSAND